MSFMKILRFGTTIRSPFSFNWRHAISMALLMCILLGLVSGSGEAVEPIKIGVSLGLTGRFSVMSDALFKGFSLWEQHLNAAGGVLGRPVHVIYRDDKDTILHCL